MVHRTYSINTNNQNKIFSVHTETYLVSRLSISLKAMAQCQSPSVLHTLPCLCRSELTLRQLRITKTFKSCRPAWLEMDRKISPTPTTSLQIRFIAWNSNFQVTKNMHFSEPRIYYDNKTWKHIHCWYSVLNNYIWLI